MKPETRRRLRNRVWGRPLAATIELGAGVLPWRNAQGVGSLLGHLLWILGTRDRKRTLAHLQIAFPDLPEAERFRLGKRATVAVGTSLGETFHLARRGPEAARPHLEIEGWEHVETARGLGSVVMIATGHCGNWELMGPAFHCKGLRLTGLVRTLEDEWMETALKRFRERLGSDVIPRGEPEAVAKLLQLRRSGGFLLALIDQDIRAQSVYVPFFGRLAHTPVGPAQLALRWSMPVVPGFCERLENGRHRIRFGPPLEAYENPTDLTAAITRTVEAQIRKRPDQWVWMHRRWRRQLPQDTQYLARDAESAG